MLSSLQGLLQQSQHYQCLYIAFSGGEDSTALLHFISQHRSKFKTDLHAVHINHRINPKAGIWAKHCQRFCQSLNIPITVLKASTQNPTANENDARILRLTLLSSFIKEKCAIVTAHHLSDQIETFWVQLQRGENNHALAGMRPISTVNKLTFLRPWLTLSKTEINDYLTDNDLSPIIDPMNYDCSILRSRIRQQWLPRLAKHFPNHSEEVTQFQSFLKTMGPVPFEGNKLTTTQLLELPKNKQLKQFIHWLHQHDCYHFSNAQCQTYISQLNSPDDKHPILSNQDFTIHRHRKRLFALTHQKTKSITLTWKWQQNPVFNLPYNMGKIELRYTKKPTLPEIIHIKINPILRSNKLLVNSQSITLKKLFNQHKIPVWARDTYPQIIIDDEIVCLPNLAVIDAFKFIINNSIVFYPQYENHCFHYA
jgi:tRNA(Ile)-lysidine synthase